VAQTKSSKGVTVTFSGLSGMFLRMASLVLFRFDTLVPNILEILLWQG
jgi:hypothetical protein